MVIILSGDDKIKLSEFLNKEKKKARDLNAPVFEYSFPENLVSDLLDIIYSRSLFDKSSRLIFVNVKKISDLGLTDEMLATVSNDKNTKLFIVVYTAAKVSNNANFSFRNTKLYKNICNYAQEMRFDLPKDYTYFNISDAIFIERNTTKAINLINSINDIDTECFAIIATIHTTLRSYVSMRYKNQTYEKLHPYVKKKLSQIRLSKSEVDKYYEALYDLDFKLKSNKQSTLTQLQDFVLNL